VKIQEEESRQVTPREHSPDASLGGQNHPDRARRFRPYSAIAARPLPIMSSMAGSGTGSTSKESIANPMGVLRLLGSKTDMYMLLIRPWGS
jgi:hypothetical protein